MFHHHQFKRTEPASPLASARSFELTENPAWAHTRFTLRCYGQGRCTIGDGAPNFFADRNRADHAGRTWVLTGIAPADQAVASC